MLVKTIVEKLAESDHLTICDFINSLSKPEKGHSFERLFDIFQRLGLIHLFPSKEWETHYGAYGNKKHVVKKMSLDELLQENTNNSSAQGGVDLLLVNKGEKSLDFKIDHDIFIEEIINRCVSEISSDSILAEMFDDTTIDDEIFHELRKSKNKNNNTSNKKISRNEDLGNRIRTTNMSETTDSDQMSLDIEQVEVEEKDQDQDFITNQKRYKQMLVDTTHFMIISNIRVTQDIEEMLLLSDYQSLSMIAKKENLSFYPEKFKKQVRAYKKDGLSKLVIKLNREMNSKNKAERYEVVAKFLTPNKAQVNKNGEVFTPLSLVNQMLDKLPEEVWSNPNLKWLDPAVGIGNFPLVVHQRLMVGLVDCFPNESDRNEHILKEMIYAVDITPLNICIYKMIMDYPEDYSGSNVIVGSFLDPQTLPNCKFDVIIGNPPYNASGSTNTGNTLWNNFVEESLNRLNDDGFLTFVHPNGWRKPSSERSRFRDLFKKMTFENSLLYLEIHDASGGLKTFKAGTRYDWYVLKRQRPAKGFLTPVKDETGNQVLFDTHKWDWLPNLNFELIEPLLGDGCDIIYDSSSYESRKAYVSGTQTEEFKYPLIHSINQKKIRYKYSSCNDRGHFGISKVIFGNNGMNDVIIDMEGRYGMTQEAMAIRVDTLEEAQKIKSALLSKNFKKVLKSCLWSSFRIEWRLFNYLKSNFYECVE